MPVEYKLITLDTRTTQINKYFYNSQETYVVDTHWNRLDEAIPMRTTAYVFMEK